MLWQRCLRYSRRVSARHTPLLPCHPAAINSCIIYPHPTSFVSLHRLRMALMTFMLRPRNYEQCVKLMTLSSRTHYSLKSPAHHRSTSHRTHANNTASCNCYNLLFYFFSALRRRQLRRAAVLTCPVATPHPQCKTV